MGGWVGGWVLVVQLKCVCVCVCVRVFVFRSLSRDSRDSLPLSLLPLVALTCLLLLHNNCCVCVCVCVWSGGHTGLDWPGLALPGLDWTGLGRFVFLSLSRFTMLYVMYSLILTPHPPTHTHTVSAPSLPPSLPPSSLCN